MWRCSSLNRTGDQMWVADRPPLGDYPLPVFAGSLLQPNAWNIRPFRHIGHDHLVAGSEAM